MTVAVRGSDGPVSTAPSFPDSFRLHLPTACRVLSGHALLDTRRERQERGRQATGSDMCEGRVVMRSGVFGGHGEGARGGYDVQSKFDVPVKAMRASPDAAQVQAKGCKDIYDLTNNGADRVRPSACSSASWSTTDCIVVHYKSCCRCRGQVNIITCFPCGGLYCVHVL